MGPGEPVSKGASGRYEVLLLGQQLLPSPGGCSPSCDILHLRHTGAEPEPQVKGALDPEQTDILSAYSTEQGEACSGGLPCCAMVLPSDALSCQLGAA